MLKIPSKLTPVPLVTPANKPITTDKKELIVFVGPP